MAIVSRDQLKAWFQRGMYPLQSQFADWIDSFWHKNEKLPMSQVEGLADAINNKADKTIVDQKQDKDSSELNTNDKTIVGAINEVREDARAVPDASDIEYENPAQPTVTNVQESLDDLNSTKLNIDGTNGTAAGVSKLINKLGSSNTIPEDNDCFVSEALRGGGSTSSSYHRRPIKQIWEYIKTKFGYGWSNIISQNAIWFNGGINLPKGSTKWFRIAEKTTGDPSEQDSFNVMGTFNIRMVGGGVHTTTTFIASGSYDASSKGVVILSHYYPWGNENFLKAIRISYDANDQKKSYLDVCFVNTTGGANPNARVIVKSLDNIGWDAVNPLREITDEVMAGLTPKIYETKLGQMKSDGIAIQDKTADDVLLGDGTTAKKDSLKPQITNNLTSTSTTAALAANQGRLLDEKKQDKEDDNLVTANKTIVGAINELSKEKPHARPTTVKLNYRDYAHGWGDMLSGDMMGGGTDDSYWTAGFYMSATDTEKNGLQTVPGCDAEHPAYGFSMYAINNGSYPIPAAFQLAACRGRVFIRTDPMEGDSVTDVQVWRELLQNRTIVPDDAGEVDKYSSGFFITRDVGLPMIRVGMRRGDYRSYGFDLIGNLETLNGEYHDGYLSYRFVENENSYPVALLDENNYKDYIKTYLPNGTSEQYLDGKGNAKDFTSLPVVFNPGDYNVFGSWQLLCKSKSGHNVYQIQGFFEGVPTNANIPIPAESWMDGDPYLFVCVDGTKTFFEISNRQKTVQVAAGTTNLNALFDVSGEPLLFTAGIVRRGNGYILSMSVNSAAAGSSLSVSRALITVLAYVSTDTRVASENESEIENNNE